MKTNLRTRIGQIAALTGALAAGALAQERREPPRGEPPDRGQDARGGQDEALTAQQAARVKDILSAYRAADLTADQAKAIHDDFRRAGLPGGPSLNAAVAASGFDPDKLRDLAPPPDAAAARGPQAPADSARQQPRGGERPQQYSISQAVSDEAQLHTIAFSGLAFLTGDFDISTSLTGDSGQAFLSALTAEQRQHITAIPDLQRKALAGIVEVRRALSTELRKFLSGQQANRDSVLALGRRYGELDGELSYLYATAFAKVGRTLSPSQRSALSKLRNLPGYASAPAYIFSDPVPNAVKIPLTNSFFFQPK